MIDKIVIKTDKAPAPIGPYSQAIQVGNLLFVSGQVAFIPATGELISNDIRNATKQTLENLEAILEEAGTSFKNVVKTTVFLKDMNDFSAMNEIYATYFSQEFPARSAIQVAKLPKDALIEIELIALIQAK